MKKGFTLVELSIVLVIIGLLLGGVLVGQSLIDSAKIAKIIREIEQYNILIQSFKNKYKALPGDINHSFSNPGDGNGTIDYEPGAGAAGEWTRLWQHLSESNELQTKYTGNTPVGTEGNVPESSVIKDGNYTVATFIAYGYRPAGQYMIIGRDSTTTWNAHGVLSPAMTASVDIKIDDGWVDSGDLITHPSTSWVPGCLTNNTGAAPVTAADYDISNNEGLCTVVLKTNFN